MPGYRGLLTHPRVRDFSGLALDSFDPVTHVRFHGFVVIAGQIDRDLLACRHISRRRPTELLRIIMQRLAVEHFDGSLVAHEIFA